MDDRRSHEEGNRSKPSRLVCLGKMNQVERHDVYVRAHTPVKPKKGWDRKRSHKWPRYCLIFDTETRVDAKQKITFGCYRRCVLDGDGYRCIEEGLFYADHPPQNDVAIRERYTADKRNIASIESFPAKTSIGLMTRSAFVNRIFWRAIQRRELIVGF